MSAVTHGRAEVAVVASRVRAEEKAILGALERRGLPVTHVDARLYRQAVDVSVAPWPVALVREISSTRAHYAALALEATGCDVLNRAAAIGTCADKWLTSLALRRAGVPTPHTVLALTPQAAAEAVEQLGYPVVLKPLGSSGGRRVSLLRDRDAAEAVLEHCAALPSPQSHIIYLQELIDKPGRDIRVLVVGGVPIAAAYRYSVHWRTNVARGAQTLLCPLSDGLVKVAVGAAAAVGAEVAGVDVIEDGDGGLHALEVNAGVEFAGLQAAHEGSVDLASAIAALVADRYRKTVEEAR